MPLFTLTSINFPTEIYPSSFTNGRFWTKIEFSNVVKCQRRSQGDVSSAIDSWQSTGEDGGGGGGVQSLKSVCLFRYWGQINSLKYKKPSKLMHLEHTQPTFHRRINVISTLWTNVETTLIRRWKWKKIRLQIFNVAQRWCNVSPRRWNNVETTLHDVGTTLIQRCLNLASTLVKAILNLIGLVMIMDLQIDE